MFKKIRSVWIADISHTNVCFQAMVKEIEDNGLPPNSHFGLY